MGERLHHADEFDDVHTVGVVMMRPDTRTAFTILEMLVSITVIAVLMAILLPALAHVRRTAVIVECQTRLSSISAMYEMYATDHAGVLPTLDYPLDKRGVADFVHIPQWGGAARGWLIMPINEIAFWAYQLREYAADDTGAVIPTVKALSCPVVFDTWRTNLPPEQLDMGIANPMIAPQRSYWHSVALFTRRQAWMNTHGAPPNLNTIHARVRLANVLHPANKANLVEASSHHEATVTRLGQAAHERINVLAMDGHVERRRADASIEPMGFVGAVTGFENPGITPAQFAQAGLPYISTRGGSGGRDF